MSSSKDDTVEMHEESTSLPIEATDKKIKSEVWEHFHKIMNPTTQKVSQTKCFYCEKLFKYDVKNGTSAMKKHMKCCPRKPGNLDKTQTVMTSFKSKTTEGVGESSSLKSWRFNQDRCRYVLARMIIEDEQPFSIVERPAFRRLLDEFQPSWTHISRFTVARDCMKIFNSEKSFLKNKLSSLKSRIALTTDIWTSIQNLSYLCLTAHFIDENWVLQKRILSFVSINSHKGKEIGKVVEKCILEWGIENKVSTITVDNASSNDVAIQYLKERLVENGALILNGEFFHVRCTAHILNLIVRDGLSEVKTSISRIRDAVKYVRSSPARAQIFEKCVKEERIAYKGMACLDVSTRWNSTYLMLEAAIKLKKAFKRLEDEDPNFLIELSYETPSVDDWEKALVLTKFLKRFYEATKRMSGTNYVTSNGYFPEIVGITTSLNQWENDSNACLQDMCRKMREKFNKYYGNIDKANNMVLIAAVLDPRYKLKYVNFCYQMIYANDMQKADTSFEYLKGVLQRLYQFYEKQHSSFQDNEASSSVVRCLEVGVGHSSHVRIGGDDIEEDPVKKAYLMAMKKENQNEDKSELEWYFDEKCEDITIDLNVLDWWKVHGVKFKVLSLLARDVFAVPVSTVASESTFSTSGRVLDQFRSCLTPTVVESLVCAQDWLSAPTTSDVENYLEDAEVYQSGLTSCDDVSHAT